MLSAFRFKRSNPPKATPKRTHSVDPGSTHPGMLQRLGDWRDDEAWLEFVARYEPFVRSCASRYHLNAAETEDYCQRIWIELARRMGTYRYDPSKTFRGWLRKLCSSRAIDLIRERRPDHVALLDDESIADEIEDETDEVGPERANLIVLGEWVHQAVRSRVEEHTWRAFWEIAVNGNPVRETAESLDMSYAATFAAHRRIRKMLHEEGQRLLGELARSQSLMSPLSKIRA